MNFSDRELFKAFLGQTSAFPLELEIERAEGVFLYGKDGKRYFDLISGISVSNLGHNNPVVIEAIKEQCEKHLHLMVYGEYIQKPQVRLAAKLCSILPPSLNNVFFVNSGSEAVEGALKLAKRFTGRSKVLSFRNAYHGSSIGALSIMGSDTYKRAFAPLMPQCYTFPYGDFSVIEHIDEHTACVVMEPVQAEAGVVVPPKGFLEAIRQRCSETGALLVFDEIQTGMGRTGKMFAFEHSGVVPDILLLAKAFGGGLPLGAFIARKELMNCLTHNPVLGHITTFGGHPLSCAAALASLNFILDNNLVGQVEAKEKIIYDELKAIEGISVRTAGLIVAVDFGSFEQNKTIIDRCIQNGVITDWFLFNDRSMRIAPPLTITDDELSEAMALIVKSIKESL